MTRDAAVAAARRGWAVFPLPPGRKVVTLKDWPNKACSDPGRVARWWPSPRHNYGIACGPSGLVVIDLDAHGELPEEWRELPGVNDGKDVLMQVCEWAGMDWPRTYTVATPSDGWHLYFQAPEGSVIRNSQPSPIGPQVDVRAAGGYVVGAGSMVGGKAYEVLYDYDPAPLPPWIARLLTAPAKAETARGRGQFTSSGQPGKRLEGLVRTVEAGKPGGRTGALVWAAFVLRDMIAAGDATEADGELLVQAAVRAGIDGGERYARQQVTSVLVKGVR